MCLVVNVETSTCEQRRELYASSFFTQMELNVSARSSSGALSVQTPALGNWNTREEARKFWDYFICDECVYFAKPLDVNLEATHEFAEKYVRNDLWFHIRWTQAKPGLAGNGCDEALVEAIPFDVSRGAFRKLNKPITAVDGNGSVFVDIPELVELPEGFCLQGIRSVVRLKRIKSGMDAGMKQGSLLPVSFLGATDRENDLVFGLGSRNRTRKQMSQVPSELIERSAETVNEVSNCKSELLAHGLWGDYEKVQRLLRVVLFGHRIRVAFAPVSNLLLSRLEVKVSPSGFHIDVLN
jgi:hypothetical protein